MTKKILAVLLALTLVFTLAACGAKENETTTVPETTTEDIFAEVTEPAAPESDTSADESTTAAEAGDTTAAATDTTAASEAATEASKAPSGTEEIVAYFNTAINSAKKDSKSIKSNYMKHAVAGEVTGVPTLIDKVLGGTGSFISGYMGEDEKFTNVTWSTAADKNAHFPVETETWASKLTAADVQSAQIKEDNGKYIIRITTKADADSSSYAHGTGHAPKAFNVVLPSVIGGYIPSAVAKIFSVGTVSMAYPSSTITVTVDIATGRVLTANYMMYWTIHIPLGDNQVYLPFSTENDYVINW